MSWRIHDWEREKTSTHQNNHISCENESVLHNGLEMILSCSPYLRMFPETQFFAEDLKIAALGCVVDILHTADLGLNLGGAQLFAKDPEVSTLGNVCDIIHTTNFRLDLGVIGLL
jgi:hypothetical protein